jgi:hypothetical protein
LNLFILPTVFTSHEMDMHAVLRGHAAFATARMERILADPATDTAAIRVIAARGPGSYNELDYE